MTRCAAPDLLASAPAQGTDAPPGSKEKVAVLARRARRGMELWHPEDAGSGRMRASNLRGQILFGIQAGLL